MGRTWNLEELAEESQRYLEHGQSRRVQWRPNGRQIRYYATLGLLDKPETENNGRTVWYGPKHLLQLLAIKRLQQDGMKLAEIQRALTGATIEEMRALVGLPESFLDQLHNSVTAKPDPRRETDFWATRPAPLPPLGPSFQQLWQLQLAPGVTLMMDQKQASQLNEREREELARALMETWRKQQEKRTKDHP